MSDPGKSPFRAVPQDRVLADGRQFGSDDSGIDFFADALARPHTDAEAVFAAGVAAMGGTGSAQGWVAFRGDLSADPAARAAFILHGPAGVRREN
ncbi:MAG: hypothetical protein RL134_1025 [Actinomycetota bacterium]|jgi:hypothetical protein